MMGITRVIKNLFSPLIIAFRTLTCIPLPFARFTAYNESSIARSTVFFPLVGLFYGVLLYVSARFALSIGLPLLLLCFIVQLLPYGVNKFFHFDGLCDVLDAFWAGKSKAERLTILKDPRLGSFALGGIIFFMLLKFILLYLFFESGEDLIYLLLIPVFSRYGMVILSYKSRYPREHGTGGSIIGRISTMVFITSWCVFLLTIAGIILSSGVYTGVLPTLAVAAPAWFVCIMLFKLYSYKKIGGITGDVLGAVNEITELVLLASCLLVTNEAL
jgi:adenosylcobinamide-GDP ribazoletransferase